MKKNNKRSENRITTSSVLYMIEWGQEDSVDDLLDAIKQDNGIGVFRSEEDAIEEALRVSKHLGPIYVTKWTISKGKRPTRIERHLKTPNPKGPGYVTKVLA